MTAATIFSAALLARVAEAAAARDSHGSDLSAEMAWLHAEGALVAALPAPLRVAPGWADDPNAVARELAALGRASLPLGRLYEGHVNAAQLIALYGSGRLKEECVARVRGGAVLGVWGADGEMPVVASRRGNGFALSGRKIFCSGLGLVDLALISARHDGHTFLVALDATDSRRADASDWKVSGMRATASGGYDFSGLAVPDDFILGRADDYYVEPYFLGGMYRMCAVQSGGLDALIGAYIAHARQRAPANPALLHYRVGSLLTQARLAGAVTQGLAALVAEGSDPAEIAQQAVLTREGVERCIVECLTIVERAAGTTVHREATALSRIARDLSFYIRQGAIDDRLVGVGAKAMAVSRA